jgi:hypothetical protein
MRPASHMLNVFIGSCWRTSWRHCLRHTVFFFPGNKGVWKGRCRQPLAKYRTSSCSPCSSWTGMQLLAPRGHSPRSLGCTAFWKPMGLPTGYQVPSAVTKVNAVLWHVTPCTHFLGNQKFHYHVLNSPSLGPILSQINPVHNLTPCFVKIQLVYCLTLIQLIFCNDFLSLPFMLHAPSILSSLIYLPPNIHLIIQVMKLLDFRLPSRCWWNLRSSGVLHGVVW